MANPYLFQEEDEDVGQDGADTVQEPQASVPGSLGWPHAG
jgi:hypothetical protein